MEQKYPEALRLGLRACRRAQMEGKSPYLPVLDSFLQSKDIAGEFPLGTMDIPVSMIAGNKTESRNNSFALNWMPIMDLHTEFASKWDTLYNSCVDIGVRDAIQCYEYLNHYYVLEGNKRVSVSKFLGIDYIPAQVTRIMPVKTGETRIQVYYEYHEFSRMSHIYDIILKERGRYEILAKMYGQTLDQVWPEEATVELGSAWNQFVRAYNKVVKKQTEESNLGPAFLTYLVIFQPSSLQSDSNEQIISNIRSIREELDKAGEEMEMDFVEEPVRESKQSGLSKLFSSFLGYSNISPLKFALLYEGDIEHSRWADFHEAGLLYAGQMIGENVKGQSYMAQAGENGVAQALDQAVEDGNEVIFTITPDMALETARASLKYPNVHFLNCSFAINTDTFRCYNARMYEATFLMGVLAASVLQTAGVPADKHVIGYLAEAPTKISLSSVNAFAIGASMIDPSCKISLRWASCIADSNYREDWEKEGVRVFSDASSGSCSEDSPEIFSSLFLKEADGSRTYLGMPFYSWGRYYTKILNSVLDGTYDSLAIKGDKAAATTYWYGLSTGVVDIRLGKNIPEQTRKLLSILKTGIIDGIFSPFSGPVSTTDGRHFNVLEGKSTELQSHMERLPVNEIASIDWLNENIIGRIPETDELTEAGQRLMRVMSN